MSLDRRTSETLEQLLALAERQTTALETIAAALAPVPSTAIPSGVYFDKTSGDFYDLSNNKRIGDHFYRQWYARAAEFPTYDLISDTMREPATVLPLYSNGINIPSGVYWSAETDKFFVVATGEETHISFYKYWYDRRGEFPPAPYTPIMARSQPEPIPPGVYWDDVNDRFYWTQNNVECGDMIYKAWYDRRGEFPTRP